jgi:hypothetical protein
MDSWVWPWPAISVSGTITSPTQFDVWGAGQYWTYVLHLIPLFHLDIAIIAESLTLPHLQLAAYPTAVAIAPVLERSTTIAAVVASAAVSSNAVEGAGTMSKGVAISSLHPSCHILRCWMDAQMLVIFHANVY